MPFFTWERGPNRQLVAKDTEGDRILYVDEGDEETTNFEGMSFKDFDIGSVTNVRRMNQRRLDLLRRHLIRNIEPLDDSISDLYQLAVKNKHKSITLREGTFSPLPSGKGREVIYITAPSGAGKSTWISKYAKNYLKMYPGNRVILLSRLGKDEVLDQIKGLRRLPLNQEIVEHPINCQEELRDTLVIFDDVDTMKGKAVKKALMELQDDILQVGRHSNTSILISSHLTTNYKETRVVLAESHKVVVFPRASSAHSLRYLLTKYVGVEKQDLSKIMRSPSRWVQVHRNFPRFVLGEKQAYILQ